MGSRPAQRVTQPRCLLFIPSRILPTTLLAALLVPSIGLGFAAAETRIVTGTGEHRMGDRDTREDAIQLATEAAKRNALEQVSTYLESVTVVTDLNMTRDEIRMYTAGVVMVQDQQISTFLEGETVVIRVDLIAEVDEEDVAQAITALRKNDDARLELVTVKAELDQLQQELEAANKALAAASTPEQVKEISGQRQELLNKVQSNAMVSQAWTDWVLAGPVVYAYPGVGFDQVQALLHAAGRLSPSNPRVQAAQQVIATQSAAIPYQPPPAVTNTSTTSPTPGSRSPMTLNEIHQIVSPTPTLTNIAPAPIQQAPLPQAATSPSSRRLQSVTQLNPFLLMPPGSVPNATPSGQQGQPREPRHPWSSRNFSRMYQQTPPVTQSSSPTVAPAPGASPAPPSVAGQPLPSRSSRYLSQRLNSILNGAPAHVPHMPSRMAPAVPQAAPQGGGGRGGGGRRGGGGGRGGGR
ncbi:MAG: hypothetical protein ACT4OO_04785 [Nitrospiraceae bacterium]